MPVQSTSTNPARVFTYKVYGNGTKAGVIVYLSGNSPVRSTNTKLPWTRTTQLSYAYYLSAGYTDGTSITCEIDNPDGSVVAKKTVTGRKATAICMYPPKSS
jgi:hypothetical protein